MKKYSFPSEDTKHEGTWSIWSHGKKYQNGIENVWIDITCALYKSENVHIIVYDKTEKQRISSLFEKKDL